MANTVIYTGVSVYLHIQVVYTIGCHVTCIIGRIEVHIESHMIELQSNVGYTKSSWYFSN